MDLSLIQKCTAMTRKERRAAIVRIQSSIVGSPTEVGPESCPLKHHFAPGSYGREMILPAGICVVGKIHKEAHLNILIAGVVEVFTEHEGLEVLRGPRVWVSQPGTKRVVHVVEQAHWVTVHVTDSTDLDEIEKEIISTDFIDEVYE